jgi:phosphatidylserine/phosphatidylglycerophosphate/cardiolipin synthase-like enzyme
VSRRLLVVALAALLMVGMLSAPATAAPWKPRPGPAFNLPTGGPEARTALTRRVIAAIKHTRKGETIRFAMYSFDLKSVATPLIKAHKRGVHVQMVVNDNWTSSQTRRLRRVLGKNPRKNHFVTICEGSCRGGPGNLHMKVYSFSKTGAAKHVLMTGSANLTERAEDLQWNDLYTVRGEEGLFRTFVRVFNELKFDRRTSPRWVTYKSGAYDAQFYRTHPNARPSLATSSTTSARLPTADEDPVMHRLKDIRCKAVKGAGVNGRTVIRIIMYGWSGDRGKYLARRVAYLKRHGCDVKVIVSVAGRGTVNRLRDANIPVRSADWDINEEGVVNFYSHLKTISVNGTYKGRPVHTVWTGSENWSIMSFRNDELILQINRKRVYREYRTRFNEMWDGRATHEWGIRPTGRP